MIHFAKKRIKCALSGNKRVNLTDKCAFNAERVIQHQNFYLFFLNTPLLHFQATIHFFITLQINESITKLKALAL